MNALMTRLSFCRRSNTRKSTPLETLMSSCHRQGVASLWAWSIFGTLMRHGDTSAPRLECALNCLDCMLQQHRVIGLQTNCMVVVPTPVVRLQDSMCMHYGPS